jgi:tetratricopeptide (TPR) repeat protein
VAVDRDKVLQAAQKLVEKKRYDKAILEYQKLIAEDPKDARTLLRMGDLYLKLEQYADAISTYEGVGQFYAVQGFALKAIAVYKQIREIVNKHVPHLEDRFGHIVPKLAELYTQLGLTSDALAAYDEVATRLQRAGRDRDAIDIFKKIVDLDPANPLPYLRLAEAFVRVKDLDSAITRFGAAAEILGRLGRRDDALKVVERLLQYRPDARFARMAAEAYLDRGQPNDGMAALTKLQICFKENPKDLDTLAILARTFDKVGQPAKSIEVQKEAARIAKDAGRLDAYSALVDALLARAPQDEGVRQLAAQRKEAAAAARAESQSDVSIEVEVGEEVFVDDEPPSEAPFVLRQSHHPAAMGGRGPGQAPAQRDAPLDPAAQVRQLLARAEVFRRARNHDQAIAILRAGLQDLPGERDLHEKLCDVLIDAGDNEGAIRQMLVFAQELAGQNDIKGAARILDEVLLLEEGQPDAIRMLAALGYAVPTPDYAPDAPYEEDPYASGYAGSTSSVGYDPNAPLPSYDLEEVGAADALSGTSHPMAPLMPGRMGSMPGLQGGSHHGAIGTDQLDDPFQGEAPLPQFSIEDEATQFLQPSSFMHQERDSATARGAAESFVPEVSPPIPSRRPSEPAGRESIAAQLDEDALDEIEFFASRGMFDDARGILAEQLGRLPNHPLLLERQRELEALAASAEERPSGARQVLRSIQPAENEDRSFDIAASLEALDALDTGSSAPQGLADDPRQISVETVFEQFKAGVAAQISESDASTHYDLGVAYREMGLHSDAINEFELASRDPGRECVCQSMIGMIHLEQGNIEVAIDSFLRGLQASHRNVEQELQLTYEIGNAYEMRNTPEQALYYFQRVARVDPTYREPRGSVGDRIARLQPAPKPPAARAVGAEPMSDEFDAAFDDLLSRGGGLP